MRDLDVLQSRGREVHTAWSGIEVHRTFYFEPYEAFEEVTLILQGHTEAGAPIPDVLPAPIPAPGPLPAAQPAWTRFPPAKDPYLPTLYCNEVRVSLTDPRLALSTSADLEVGNAADGNPIVTILDKLETNHESPGEGYAGGFITAIYRPLITALTSGTESGKFDWMDPKFNPVFKQIPWPTGLKTFVALESLSAEARAAMVAGAAGAIGAGVLALALGQGGVNGSIPSELADTITVPIFEFTIRRLLVHTPPYDAIAWCAGKLNSVTEPFPATNLPNFFADTLRFDGANIQNRLDALGNEWFEIIYHFSWLNMLSHDVYSTDGLKIDRNAAVTWNHVFMRPSFFDVSLSDIGWWPVVRDVDRRIFAVPIPAGLGLTGPATGGPLYSTANFLDLFRLPQ